jgi:hypothetical protein
LNPLYLKFANLALIYTLPYLIYFWKNENIKKKKF